MDIPQFVFKDAGINPSETLVRIVTATLHKVNRYDGHNITFDNGDEGTTTDKNLIVVVKDYRDIEHGNTYFVFPKEMNEKLDKHIKIATNGGKYWYDLKNIVGIAPKVYLTKSEFCSKMLINRLRYLEKFTFGKTQQLTVIR